MIITADELKAYTKDSNVTILDNDFLKMAQEKAEEHLGYLIEEDEYVYDEIVYGEEEIYLDAPIQTVTSITLNGVALTDYKIMCINYIVFPYSISGKLVINYTGGYTSLNLPSTIRLGLLGVASEIKKSSGLAIGVSQYSLPNGVNQSFLPPASNGNSAIWKHLHLMDNYRLIYA